jgi:ankyrin repeat protein
VLHDVQIDPQIVANKLATTEVQVRKVIDEFKLKGIYLNSKKDLPKEPIVDPVMDAKKQEAEGFYKNIWSIATRGNVEKLKLIAEHGFDLNVKCPTYGSTALMYACQNGRLECVNLLLEYGADVTIKNNREMTALHFATTAEMVTSLVKKGADVNAVEKEAKQTPLHRALIMGRSNSVIKELIRNMDLNQPNVKGVTPLHLLLMYFNDYEFNIQLLTKDINLTTKTNEGNTLLHLASCHSLPVVKRLLELGADATVTNNVGQTPLMSAAMNGKADIVAELHNHIVTQYKSN